MSDLSALAVPGTEEERLLSQLDLDRLPKHVAVIMDGNGRWARERRLPRVAGHRAGIDAVRDTLETSARLGLEVLELRSVCTEDDDYVLEIEPSARGADKIARAIAAVQGLDQVSIGLILEQVARPRR